MFQEIIARLKGSAALPAVEFAEDISAIFEGTAPRSGDCFVVPHRMRASPNKLVTVYRQHGTEQFLVVTVIRTHNDPTGVGRSAEFEAKRSAIESLLGGWQPPSCAEICELVGQENTRLDNNVSVYVQTWETTRFVRGA
ncbi:MULTISPECIES: hypothetical protein [unclassified Ensifer]|uniref:phage tail terminator protein n=1 Tax=unclassified Ensifer TaxID=2633371 RepID=UPI0008138DCD|nr:MULTISPECIES: hypothetical protein [unclassified Ensifer]OCP17376.1 hypothetical protein BC361_07910 [Ensifer sp. LC54]OCP28719.1 hypothetical protein BC363_02450 [Ensifer sp. LC384]